LLLIGAAKSKDAAHRRDRVQVYQAQHRELLADVPAPQAVAEQHADDVGYVSLL
jgi:hypothetical protein